MGSDFAANWPSVLILGGVIGFALWAIAATRRNQHQEYFAFRLLLVAVGIWFVSFAVMYAANDVTSALLWARIGTVGIAFVPAAVYSFAVAMYWNLNPVFRQPRYRFTTGVAWAVSAALATIALVGPKGLLSGVQWVDWRWYGLDIWVYYPRIGPAGLLLLTFALSMVLLTLLHFRAGYKLGARMGRLRTRRFTIALGIGSLALIDALPSANIPVPPLGFIPLAVGIGIAFSTMRRYPLASMVPPEPWDRVLDGLNEALLYVGEQGAIRSANKAALEMFGLKKETLRDTYLKDLFPDYPLFQDVVSLPTALAAMEDKKIVHRPTKDVYRILDLYAAPLYQDRHGPLNIVCLFEDVTARVEAERALQESNHYLTNAVRTLEENLQTALEQERLRALGYVASGVVHDLSNILTPIMSYTEILRASPKMQGTREGQEALEAIYEAALDARQALTRLRSFYKQGDGRDTQQPLDINSLIQAAVILTQPKWKDMAQAEGRTVHVRLDLSDVAPVQAEPSELREAFVNLIFNAVDALETGGVITLRTRMEEGKVLAEVEDTGVGMTEEVRRRALEPFFTTKGQEGTGLGLPLVHQAVIQSGGTLRISSRPGAGTTVCLQFPVSSEAVATTVESRSQKTVRRLHVLLVDDNLSVHEAVSQFLQLDGHKVDVVSTPHEALERFRETPYDLVLTDWSMPEMSGNQLALAVKALSPRTPVILMTGFGNTGLVAEGTAGFETVLAKPFTRSELHAAVRQAVTSYFVEEGGSGALRVLASTSRRQTA